MATCRMIATTTPEIIAPHEMRERAAGMPGFLGGKVDLVPGLRMQGVSGGWLIRPAVGLAWAF